MSERVSIGVVEAALAEERARLPAGFEFRNVFLTDGECSNWSVAVMLNGAASSDPEARAAIARVQARFPRIGDARDA